MPSFGMDADVEKAWPSGSGSSSAADQRNAVLDGINRIFREALAAGSEEELGRCCLEVAEDVTGSAFSFMGEINFETDRLDDLSISARAWAAFTMDDPDFPVGKVPTGFKIHGLNGRVLRDGKSLIVNDPASHPDRVGMPNGHPPLHNFLGVPLIHADRTIGMIGLGNRVGGYREEDREAVEALAPAILHALLNKRSEAAVRSAEARLRQFGEASQDVLWIRDAETLAWSYLTPAFERIYGLPRDEAMKGDNFSSWLDLILPEDRDHAQAMIRRVQQGEEVVFEYRVQRPVDGQIRWLRNTDFPITGPNGTVTSIGGIGEDITDIKAVEERLRGSEERLRLALDVAHMGTWDWNMQTNEVAWSEEHFRLEGYEVGEIEPSYEAWVDRVHPEDRASVEQAMMDARDRRLPYVKEFRAVHPDGAVVWLSAIGQFFYDAEGQPIRMIGVMQDVTDRLQWQERQQTLVAELQHRTRNLISVVRSVADKTERTSDSLPEFRTRFRDRLDALARVQGLLSRLDENDRVTFRELIVSELEAIEGPSDRITLEGPRGVRLRSSMVQTLALALHELATNAVKYGALSQPDGRLSVIWRLERRGRPAEPWLHIDWRETGVIMPADLDSIPRDGQGRDLIERALPYQFKAETRFVLGPDGVHCTLSIPVSASEIGRRKAPLGGEKADPI